MFFRVIWLQVYVCLCVCVCVVNPLHILVHSQKAACACATQRNGLANKQKALKKDRSSVRKRPISRWQAVSQTASQPALLQVNILTLRQMKQVTAFSGCALVCVCVCMFGKQTSRNSEVLLFALTLFLVCQSSGVNCTTFSMPPHHHLQHTTTKQSLFLYNKYVFFFAMTFLVFTLQ